MDEIKSKDNSKLKLARKVASGKSSERIFVEGLRLAAEALASEIEIVEMFVTKEFCDKHSEISLELSEKCDKTFLLSSKLLHSIADTKSPQGLVLLCKPPKSGQDKIEKRIGIVNDRPQVVILLHNINNPSNLGAILRTAEAAGATGVVTTVGSADAFSPKSIRSSMGAAFRIPVWSRAEFDAAIRWATDNSLSTTCADVNSAIPYTKIDWKMPRLVVFGSEAHGLTENERESIETSVYIPTKNSVESLNLAVSCGVILYEVLRQNAN